MGEEDAAATLLSFSKPAASINKKKSMPIAIFDGHSIVNVQSFRERVQALYAHGYTSDEVEKAKYPKLYVAILRDYEKVKRRRQTSNYELVPYHKLFYYTKTSPHVVCPNCKGHFVLNRNGSIRDHSCRTKV